MSLDFKFDGQLLRTFTFSGNTLISMRHNAGAIYIDSPIDLTLTLSQLLVPGFYCTIIQKGAGRANVVGERAEGLAVDSVSGKFRTAAAADIISIYSPAPGKFILFAPGTPGGGNPPAIAGNALVSGNATWANGLLFDVTDCEYYIAGQLYNSARAQIELNSADPDNPRIDVIYLDRDGNVGILTGNPAPVPSKPLVNTGNQIELTFINIAAGASTPTGIFNLDIYQENVEWVGDSNSRNVDFASTDHPQSGNKCIKVPDPSTPTSDTIYTSFFTLTAPQPVNANDYYFLRFYIKVSGDGFSGSVVFYNNALATSATVALNSSNGFNPSLMDEWQLITIPIAGMTLFSANFNKLLVNLRSESGTAVYFDNIVLQGVAQNTTQKRFGKSGEDVTDSDDRTFDLSDGKSFTIRSVKLPDDDDPRKYETIITLEKGQLNITSTLDDTTQGFLNVVPGEVFFGVNADGHTPFVSMSGKGIRINNGNGQAGEIILQSPNGLAFAITVDNDGTLSANPV